MPRRLPIPLQLDGIVHNSVGALAKLGSEAVEVSGNALEHLVRPVSLPFHLVLVPHCEPVMLALIQ